MARFNINTWNASIDRTLTVRRMGRQGILYEYLLPYGANPMHYYEEALDVRSIKSSENYYNGKRPGQYQPIGDKRYFTYYQLRKMSQEEKEAWNIERYAEIIAKSLMDDFPM